MTRILARTRAGRDAAERIAQAFRAAGLDVIVYRMAPTRHREPIFERRVRSMTWLVAQVDQSQPERVPSPGHGEGVSVASGRSRLYR